MDETGKPREFSAAGQKVAHQEPRGKAALVAVLAAVVLAVLLLVISGCMPTPA